MIDKSDCFDMCGGMQYLLRPAVPLPRKLLVILSEFYVLLPHPMRICKLLYHRGGPRASAGNRFDGGEWEFAGKVDSVACATFVLFPD